MTSQKSPGLDPGPDGIEASAITDIELCPDGRIFIFGACPEILSLLQDCGLADDAVRSRFVGDATKEARLRTSAILPIESSANGQRDAGAASAIR